VTRKIFLRLWYKNSSVLGSGIGSKTCRDSKRRSLLGCRDKRKVRARALTFEEIQTMARGKLEASMRRQDSSEALQGKLLHICACKVAWRSTEAANCKVHFFKDEIENTGQ
jgi:hypothetical protein